MLFEADKRAGIIRLTTSDTAMSVSVSLPARIDEGGAVVIANIRLFLDYLAIAQKGTLSLSAGGNDAMLEIRFEAGNARLGIKTFPESAYPKPEIPMPGETVYVTGLKSLIARTAFIVSDNEAYGIAKCVKLTLDDDGITAEAANNFSLVKSKGDSEAKGKISLIVPAEAMKILAHISDDKDVFEFGITGSGENGTAAVFFDGTTLFSARLASGKIPDTEAFLSKVGEAVRARVNAKDLLDALDRVTVFASPKAGVAISFADGEMNLKCEADNGISSASIPVSDFFESVPARGPYHFNATRLAECLKAAGGEPTLIISDRGHILIKTENSRFLQLGIVTGQKEEPTEKDAAA
jgi:DNA polymerase III sliding clamp (beta) subunit (PCNA family)